MSIQPVGIVQNKLRGGGGVYSSRGETFDYCYLNCYFRVKILTQSQKFFFLKMDTVCVQY